MAENTRKKILIGDDDKFIRNMLSKALIQDGYDVQAVKTGREAFEYASNNRIDALITDIYMENMDGRELVEMMKRLSPDVPVIVMTGDQRVELERVMRELGVFAFFSKPIEVEILKRTLNAAVEKKKR